MDECIHRNDNLWYLNGILRDYWVGKLMYMFSISTTTLLILLNSVRSPNLPLKNDLKLDKVAEARCASMIEWSHKDWPYHQIWNHY